MDVIRCDEQEYLVWKWRPSGSDNSTKKENSIRFGSSLRVKDGELAVFVYQQKDGSMQDFIVGPSGFAREEGIVVVKICSIADGSGSQE